MDFRGPLGDQEGGPMPAYKGTAHGSWYCQFYYVDWTGKRKKKEKRMFPHFIHRFLHNQERAQKIPCKTCTVFSLFLCRICTEYALYTLFFKTVYVYKQ